MSPHHLASRAGIDTLHRGGNAVDAAIAVNAVLGVVLPETCGPGGDLFAIVHIPGEDIPLTLNASGRAGSGVTADDLRNKGYGEIPPLSPWSITVPGCVDGWVALSDRLGRLDLATCLAPAIAIAEDGFPSSSELASALSRLHESLASQPAAVALYPNSDPPAPGHRIRRPDLASTLRAVAADGRDGFYLGPVGEGITNATDGAITPADLSVDQAEWIDPAHLDIFGRTAWTIPPNSQGYLTLATLAIFESLDPPTDPTDPLYQHLLIESYRSVAWERAQYVADPSTAPLTPAELLDRNRLDDIGATIDRGAAGRWPMPPPAPGGTAYMNTMDADGMAVSYIQSNFRGIGSRRCAGDTGVFLHNRGAGFNLIQGHPNEYEPGHRPLHTLSPTLWTAEGEVDLVLGTRGGDQQPQYLAQIAAAHYHGAYDVVAAQEAPRWSMEQPKPGTDSALTVEARFESTVVEHLAHLGHSVDEGVTHNPGYGPVSMIKSGANPEAAADPRVSTTAALSTAAR